MARRSSEKRKTSTGGVPSAELDALYAVPLAEFTAARNALARKLRDAGHEEAADEVKALQKPTPAAWAINQLSRRFPDDVRALLDASERLRQAQRQALRGGGAEALRGETRAQRGLLLVLTDDAGQLLREAGKAPSRTLLDQIQRTLTAAANGAPEEQRLLEQGRLTRPLDPTSFGGLIGVRLPASGPRDPPAVHEERERAARQAREERERAAAEAQRKREERERAAQQKREEREQATRARTEQERQRQLERLRQQLGRKERELDRLEAAARKAEEAAARARSRVEPARRYIEALRRDIANVASRPSSSPP